MHSVRYLWLSMLVVAFVGCGGGGPAVEPVTGTITVDGSPVAGVKVTLVSADSSEAMGLTGITDEAGKFSIFAAGGYEGAPAGKYKVLLSPPRPEVDYSSGGPPRETTFPPRYSNPDSGEITQVEVGSGANEVTINVETK